MSTTTSTADSAPSETVVKQGFGLRLPVLGPVENADLVGPDLTLDIHRYILPRLDPPSEPSLGLQERVACGELGMRTGSGFRRWTEADAEQVRTHLRSYLAAAGRPSED